MNWSFEYISLPTFFLEPYTHPHDFSPHTLFIWYWPGMIHASQWMSLFILLLDKFETYIMVYTIKNTHKWIKIIVKMNCSHKQYSVFPDIKFDLNFLYPADTSKISYEFIEFFQLVSFSPLYFFSVM